MDLYIADDNRAFAEYVAEVARGEGWSTYICSHGAELLDALTVEDGPALLLIDVNMPVMDGIEVIEGLLNIQRDLCIRFITGGPDTSALAARMIANARSIRTGRFLLKPLSIKALRQVLAEETKAMRGVRSGGCSGRL